MEDLEQLYELTETFPRNMERLTEEWLVKLRVILWGQSAVAANAKDSKDMPAASPQQSKKRAKRLTSLNEEEAEDPVAPENANNNNSSKLSKGEKVSPPKIKRSNEELVAAAKTLESSEEAKIEHDTPKKKSLEAATKEPIAERRSDATSLMPPPPAPIATAPTEESHTGRPQRAAKLKSEKCLKEPKLNMKIRRPTEDGVNIKLEHEQRASQMHEKSSLALPDTSIKTSMSSTKSNDSIVLVPSKKADPVNISSNSEEEEGVPPMADTVTKKKRTVKPAKGEETIRESLEPGLRELRVKIKREKVSIQPQEETPNQPPSKDATFKAPAAVLQLPATTRSNNSTLQETSSIHSSTTNTSKKGRKKKETQPHKPIKVERFSDLDKKPSPVASRTRHGSTGKPQCEGVEKETHPQPDQPTDEEAKRPGSVYEDAVETPPSRNSKLALINETVTLGSCPASDATINLGPVAGDATFVANPAQTTFQVAPGQTTFVLDAGNPNATVTMNKNSGALCDATFEVHSTSKNDKEDDVAGHKSFETAKDSSVPNTDSLITDDESCGPSPPKTVKQKAPPSVKPALASSVAKGVSSAKSSYKVPPRTNELFNPLAQSPVKMRVEAFENAAASAAADQPKRLLRNKKENVTPTSAGTPVIGKLAAPALGRFLTPTQSSNVFLGGSAYAKKLPTSASKALTLPKSTSSNLQRSSSNASTKALQRENSADDFRKNLHNLAEERKKQREQKHLLAAQQREAKERERAERIAKLAREKEEKRMQKQQEKLEQQKRDMEEIQRKLRLQQEEEAKIKAAKEREMLMAMKQQQQMLAKQRMMPPPAKTASKYTFEMLHEDDSTDDEDKVSYKRPPPPSWSRSHKRGPCVLKQEYTPSCYIDSFFSVQPMTPDLKQIFPNIDARHLKRNSSVLWSTPPRYSELPKY